MTRFSDEQIRRYSRQILLREIGGHGQLRLGAARPALLCAGAVGEVAAEYLWRAGVTAPVLFSPTPELAARLSAQLAAAGYPGPPARGRETAGPEVQRLADAAPGFTLLWMDAAETAARDGAEQPRFLWAGCSGTLGFVGQGSAALRAIALAHPADAAGPGGALAMIVGSALALLAVQRLAGLAGLPGDSPELPGAVWRVDLTGGLDRGAPLPEWTRS